MKRFLLVLLLLPSLAFGAFTEFYYQSGGSNVNSGSTNSNTATYTSTNGNWSTVTNIFTPTDGSTPASTVNVGDFASVYNDGATVAVYIARITAVAAGVNGGITLTTVYKQGTPPTTSATARTIKVGGAWQTPFNATGFPLINGIFGALRNTNDDVSRVNFKNDQTYSTTGGSSWTGMGATVLQGYTTTPGDGGRAIWSSSTTAAVGFLMNSSAPMFVDMVFTSSAASNGNDLLQFSNGASFVRCVFHDSRGDLVNLNNAGASFIDCEFYAANKSNTAGKYAIDAPATVGLIDGCYIHDLTAGSNASGINAAGRSPIISNTIFDTISGVGISITSTTVDSTIPVIHNCSFYNITGDAIKHNTTTGIFLVIKNCIFTKGGAKGINMAAAIGGGVSQNNAYGAGTEANATADTLLSVVETGKVTLPSNTSPYSAQTTGNFSLIAPTAQGTGYGTFLETDGTNTGTVGYPDIGAAQANIGVAFPTPTPTPSATATATPTATPTSTPVQTSYAFPQ